MGGGGGVGWEEEEMGGWNGRGSAWDEKQFTIFSFQP